LSPSTKPTFLDHLREALINVGFFYLRNPPISLDVQHVFSEKALELFDLPLEKKLEIEMVNSPHFLGYSRLGAEITALKPDYREQFDVRFLHAATRSHAHHKSVRNRAPCTRKR
jgi:isopenicillin N synthase-like dioxygenase